LAPECKFRKFEENECGLLDYSGERVHGSWSVISETHWSRVQGVPGSSVFVEAYLVFEQRYGIISE
jgi:hypothetical protein